MISEFIPGNFRKTVRLAQLEYSTESVSCAPQIVHSEAKPLIIGPLLDPVFVDLRARFSNRAHFVRWEDFRRTWDYRVKNGMLELIVDGKVHSVTALYVRSCEVSLDFEYYYDLQMFVTLLSTLKIRRLGTVDLGISNFSKILQLRILLRDAAEGLASVAIPETLVIKSKEMTGAGLARAMGPSVAKSVSSARTQVFDDRLFRHFGHHRPAHTPVLIQKKKSGMEIRVHVIDGAIFPLGIQKLSDTVDYRYGCEVELVHDVHLSAEEIEFCRRVQRLENNPLIGLDLIRDQGVTYCFEANPNPGWACFDYEIPAKEALAQAILKYLEGA